MDMEWHVKIHDERLSLAVAMININEKRRTLRKTKWAVLYRGMIVNLRIKRGLPTHVMLIDLMSRTF